MPSLVFVKIHMSLFVSNFKAKFGWKYNKFFLFCFLVATIWVIMDNHIESISNRHLFNFLVNISLLYNSEIKLFVINNNQLNFLCRL